MLRPLCLAHRGHRAAGPENSLRSVVAAFEVADGAEVDVLVTADGKAVLRHDECLADGTPLRALSLAEARRRLGADADDLPLVSDVFRRLEGARGTLDVELKVPGAAAALRAAGTVPAAVAFTSFLVSEDSFNVTLMTPSRETEYSPSGMCPISPQIGHWLRLPSK